MRVWREEDVGERRKPTGAGHTADLLPVLFGDDQETSEWFLDAMGWPDHISRWDSDDGLTACAMLIAALSHHGRPLNVCDTLPRNRRIWRRFGGLTPKDCVERISELARDWFPAAFSASAPALPSQPAFQHMFLGLCNLADWLGSNEDMFPFYAEQRADYIDTAREQAKRAVKAVGLDIADQRAAFLDLPRFARLFDIEGASAPNAIQKKAFATPLEERLVIIESETGSGKTEAAVWRFAHMYERKLVDGLYFALPTRAAASQMARSRQPIHQADDAERTRARARPRGPGLRARWRLDRATPPQLSSVVGRYPRPRNQQAAAGPPKGPSGSWPPRSPSGPWIRR